MATVNDSLSHAEANSTAWQRELKDAVRDKTELAALLELPREALDAAADQESGGAPAGAAETDFPLLVPRAFVARMRKRDPYDPLLRQVLPTALELAAVPGFTADPVDERRSTDRGVVRKYAGRSLLITTGACPVHCRYCFRRAFPYAEQLAARNDFDDALAALEADGADEVILSGGDPLSLGNRRLASLIERLESLPALRRIRIHTRFPIVLPARVDKRLVEMLERMRLRCAIVLHANHPQEIDAAVSEALGALRGTGAMLLNQAVLLRGVNDDADVLANLSERLFDCGVLPYYLHMLDPVEGAAHFEVAEHRASELHAALLARLPGYLVPRLVREIPGRPSKTPV